MAPPAPTGSSRLLAGAGFLAWGAVALGQIVTIARAPNGFGSRHAVGVLALLTFATAFGWGTRSAVGALRSRRIALGAQTLAAAIVAVTESSDLALVLLVVTAAQAPMLFSVRQTALFLVAQNVVVFAWQLTDKAWLSALLLMTSYLAFQGFACVMAFLVQREAEARHALGMVLTELAAAQAELGETHRSAERLRIARDLHDQIGHQLTALNLQLEVATNTRDEDAKVALTLARSLGRELLGDLRSVVSAERAAPEFDLVAALQALSARVREPRVRLVLRNDPHVQSPDAALALFRCAQEATTNAARHAHASTLELVLERTEGGVRLVASDDGGGTTALVFGNGLSGLRERLEDVGGRLAIESRHGLGFTLTAWVAEVSS